jgi:glyoxylate reductase
MMMLMLLRKADAARQAFQDRIIGEPCGEELHCKTLGIIGRGKVGNCLAAACQALGMRVLHTTSTSTRAELEQLLRESDVISLHAHLTPETEGMIGAAELALMKPAAVLINTARGPLIDKAALLDALDRGCLGGVGLDVHWVEPADPNEPLYQNPKVLALPHSGAATEGFCQRVAGVLCENIMRIREGRPLLHQLDLGAWVTDGR